MGYLPEATIAETVARIRTGDLVLPAIQREFVWEADQVVALFDSLMRGYPIGGFLSWKVQPEVARQFRFYGFLRDYNEFNNRHCPNLGVAPDGAIHAVLDGQQRLTALNIGLRGSYAYRSSGAWRTKAASYPTRRLHLNLAGEAGDNEAGLQYDLRLLTDGQIASAQQKGDGVWLPVSDIADCTDAFGVMKLLGAMGLGNDEQALGLASRLWQAVHMTASLKFYEETDPDVERVLDIFIRVNSGGTPLSYSDLLLSIATAQWDHIDARDAIHTLVDTLNKTGDGFKFSQDTVLKSGLVLAGVNDFAFRVRNFNADNMALLQREWERIAGSLELAVNLLHDFGLSQATLTADSVLIPVAYYVHRNNYPDAYRTATKHAADREALRLWVLRTLVMAGVWGSGLDTLLRDLRDAIDAAEPGAFPTADIERRMAARGKGLTFGDQQIDDLLGLSYGQRRTFATLALLFPHVNTRNNHHVDHIFPKALLHRTALRKQGFDEDEITHLQSLRDQLPNLQLLEGLPNIEKSSKDPKAWADTAMPDPSARQRYLDLNALPPLPATAAEFGAFFAERRRMLADLMRARLNPDPA